MGILAIGLEHPLDVTFQRSHDPMRDIIV